MAFPFWCTRFDDIYASELEGEYFTVNKLAELIGNTRAAKKEALPILKLARFGSQRLPPTKAQIAAFGPNVLGTLRHDANVLAVSGVEGDHDAGELPFDEVVIRLEEAGIAYIAYATPSHTPGQPRWRVLCPFSKELPPAERGRMASRLNGVLGGVLARESWTISPAWYIGRVDGVDFKIAFSDDERCIDESDELDALALPFQAPKGKQGQTGAGKGVPPDFAKLDEIELRELMTTGQYYFRTGSELAYRWAQQGVSRDEAEDNLRAAFDEVPSALQQEKKWRKGRAAIPKWVARAFARAAAAAKKPRGGGRPLNLVPPEPWPDEVDGAALLDELAEVCLRHVVMPEPAAHAVALWILHTFVFSVVLITPRLLFKSPQKRSGKTTLLTLVGAMASRALMSANISASAVFRTIEEAQPTLLIDEADTFLPDNEELRGVLNAGFMRGGQAIRTVGEDHEPRVFSCWCPVAIATIKKLPDTIEDRAVAITLKRRRKDEKVTRLRLDRLASLAPLASKAQRWANDNVAAIEAADPEIPNQLNDRAADCWRVLLAIADRIGKHWPMRAREAAVTLALDNEDIETVLTQLLADLRDLFAEKGNELFSSEIVDALGGMEDRPWAEYGKRRQPITKVQLARLLAQLKIRPRDIRRGTLNGKGYRLDQFTDQFERYLS
jgi:putative DNA primase/helicase